MNDLIIKAREGVKYLSEIPEFDFENLPDFCHIDKTITGCGATTEAITSSDNTVICVPSVSAIENKVIKHRELIPLFHETNISTFKKAIEEAINDTTTLKIITTFDSILKVIRILKEDYVVDLKQDVNLFVDESHQLLKSYSFRKQAVNGVLKAFKEFRKARFVSATPVNPAHELGPLKELQRVKIAFEESKPAVDIIEVKSGMVQTIAKALTTIEANDENFYIFCNSVGMIRNVINLVNAEYSDFFDNKNTNVVVADNEKNRQRINTIKISNSIESTRKFNFLTSRAFDSIDIYDDKGRIFMITDEHHDTTFLDVKTDIKQITGRIRNYSKSTITHFIKTLKHVKESGFDDPMTHEKQIEEILKASYKVKEIWESFTEKEKQMNLINFENTFCVYDEQLEKVIIDENLISVQKNNYGILHDYKDIAKAYQEEGYEVDNHELELEFKKTKKKAPKQKITLKEDFENYRALKSKMFLTDEEFKEHDAIEYRRGKLIKLMFEFSKKHPEQWEDIFSKRRFKATEIQNYFDEIMRRNNLDKFLAERVIKGFRVGRKYSNKDCKEILQTIYDESYKSKIKAKASEIEKWFIVRRIRIDSGKGFEIISKKDSPKP